MSYANVKAFILILVVMAVPAVILAAPAGFQAPSIPMPSIPSAMQAPFMGGRDTNSRGQGQFGGSNSNRGPFGGQQMSGMFINHLKLNAVHVYISILISYIYIATNFPYGL